MTLPNRQKRLLAWLLTEFPDGSLVVHWQLKGFRIANFDSKAHDEFTKLNLLGLQAAELLEIDRQEDVAKGGYGVVKRSIWVIRIAPGAGKAAVVGPEHLRSLQIGIVQSFNLDELDNLCLELGINPEEIAGETIGARARNLVLHMDRHSRLPDLFTKLREWRQDRSWHNPLDNEPGQG